MTQPSAETTVEALDDDELAALYRHIERQRHTGLVGEADMELQSRVGLQLFERGYDLDDILPPTLRDRVVARRRRRFD